MFPKRIIWFVLLAVIGMSTSAETIYEDDFESGGFESGSWEHRIVVCLIIGG